MQLRMPSKPLCKVIYNVHIVVLMRIHLSFSISPQVSTGHWSIHFFSVSYDIPFSILLSACTVCFLVTLAPCAEHRAAHNHLTIGPVAPIYYLNNVSHLFKSSQSQVSDYQYGSRPLFPVCSENLQYTELS